MERPDLEKKLHDLDDLIDEVNTLRDYILYLEQQILVEQRNKKQPTVYGPGLNRIQIEDV